MIFILNLDVKGKVKKSHAYTILRRVSFTLIYDGRTSKLVCEHPRRPDTQSDVSAEGGPGMGLWPQGDLSPNPSSTSC